MTSPFEISDDPEVDFLRTGEKITILLDLRFRDLDLKNVDVRSDSELVYVYDKSSNTVVKIIPLPFKIRPNIATTIRNGIIIICSELT